MEVSKSTDSRAYVSLLSTDNFANGVLALAHSLKRVGADYPFIVFTTPHVSPAALSILNESGIAVRPIDYIENPNAKTPSHPWRHNYCQLGLFDRIEFSKIVYLDLDMIVCRNIDDVFEAPHFSAVSSGSWLPRLSHWGHLNGGLMVIEPNHEEFVQLVSRIGKPTSHEGNQGIFSAHFPDWDQRSDLHLDHRYNLMNTHLDEYHKLYKFRLPQELGVSRSSDDGVTVKVVHYAGPVKPWMMIEKIRQWARWRPVVRMRASMQGKRLEVDSFLLWLKVWDDYIKTHGCIGR